MPAGAAGFSLVELAACLAIIGLLVLVCVEGLQGMIPAARVNRAVREMAALLEWSRWRAVRQGCPYRVTIDTDAQRINVYREAGAWSGTDDEAAVRVMDLGRDHRGVVFGTASGVHRTSGCSPVAASGVHLRDSSVRFLPTGVPDRCGSLYLIPEADLPGRKDRMRAITILLATGRVQLWRYDPSEASGCEDEEGAWVPM